MDPSLGCRIGTPKPTCLCISSLTCSISICPILCSCRHLRVSARPRRIYKRSPTLEEQRLLRKVTGNRRCERRASLEIVSAARPPLNSRSPTAGSDLGIARCPAQPGPRTPEAPLHPLWQHRGSSPCRQVLFKKVFFGLHTFNMSQFLKTSF